jgi:hypothetical protein
LEVWAQQREDPAMTRNAGSLVRDLLRPEAYGRDPTASVALRTTHASWVFLVGDDVWKLKRPVDFGFLDFRTVESRRHACEEEVRLNRRLGASFPPSSAEPRSLLRIFCAPRGTCRRICRARDAEVQIPGISSWSQACTIH